MNRKKFPTAGKAPSAKVLAAVAHPLPLSRRTRCIILVVALIFGSNALRINFFSTASTAPLTQLNEQMITLLSPSDNAYVHDTMAVKSVLKDHDLADYRMYWQVDGAQLNAMDDSQDGGSHKEALINFGSWNWRGTGPYVMTLNAIDLQGNVLSKYSFQLFIGNQATAEAAMISSSISSSSVSSVQSSSLSAAAAFVPASAKLTVASPVDGTRVFGPITLSAYAEGVPLSSYRMFWEVDNGSWNAMTDDAAAAPRKSAKIDVSSWTWKGSGPYGISFHAQDLQGREIGTTKVYITVDPTVKNSSSSVSSVTTLPASSARSSSSYSSSQSSAAPVATAVIALNPVDGARLHNTQVFAAAYGTRALATYSMWWKVDTGNLNPMPNDSTSGGLHKEVPVNIAGWNWRGAGPYAITFVAKDLNGNIVAQKTVSMFVGATASSSSTSSSASSVSSAPSLPVAGNPLSGYSFYVAPDSNAKNQADAWRTSRPNDAALMDKIAQKPLASWLGNWNPDVRSAANAVTSTQTAAGKMPLMIAYNFPGRDCGNFSAGGAGSADAYKAWITSVADGIGQRKAIVVLEPDATSLGCFGQQQYDLLKTAISLLKTRSKAIVYLDAGHAGWIDPATMAARLKNAGVDQADGFALNISNFNTTAENTDYGNSISSQIGGKHFLIDVSRNGNGSNGQWCNPWGRAMGAFPTTNTGIPLVDALIYGKDPGGSDGYCNGGPAAGVWWPEYALDIAKNTH